MNQKTQLESDYSTEFSDIARYRLEQERRNNNTSGLDPRDYELLPNTGLERALKQARNDQNNSHMDPTNTSSSKLAGIPFSSSASREQKKPSSSSRVSSSSVPPAPRPASAVTSSSSNNNSNIHTPVENYGTQQDIRRHLDRLKLDTQEAVAKMRQSPVVQGLM